MDVSHRGEALEPPRTVKGGRGGWRHDPRDAGALSRYCKSLELRLKLREEEPEVRRRRKEGPAIDQAQKFKATDGKVVGEASDDGRGRRPTGGLLGGFYIGESV